MRRKRPVDTQAFNENNPVSQQQNVMLGNDAPVQNVGRALDDILNNHPSSLRPRVTRLDYAAFHRYGRRDVRREGMTTRGVSREGEREEDKKVAE